MPYKVHKLQADRRNNTCGYAIPNGGFYWVVEMTFENHRQLVHLSQRHGYSVDFVEGPLGFFDANGYQVDPDSIEVDKITKQVVGYEKLVKTKRYRGKETVTEIQVKHEGLEREEAIRQAQSLGYAVSREASTQTIKEAISQGQRAPQSSLSQALS